MNSVNVYGHANASQSDSIPDFDLAAPEPSFGLFEPIRGGLAAKFHIIVLLHNPSAPELRSGFSLWFLFPLKRSRSLKFDLVQDL